MAVSLLLRNSSLAPLSPSAGTTCIATGPTVPIGLTNHTGLPTTHHWTATQGVAVINRFRFATRAEARRVITQWINHYNGQRQRSSINRMLPIEWELQFARLQFQAK
jgi:transposase InsO family protein